MARARYQRRPPVRLVAAGGALRRPRRVGGRIRPRDRVRRRVDDAGTDVVERTRRHRAVQRRVPGAHRQHPRDPILGCSGARRSVRGDAGGDGRVRARESSPRRREHRQRALRPRDPAGADEGRARAAHRRRAVGRRGHPARRYARVAGGAAAGVGVGGATRPRHHRRELLADERRGFGDAHRRPGDRGAARPPDPGSVRPLRGCLPTTRSWCCRRRTR
jgi:hypothetical protein